MLLPTVTIKTPNGPCIINESDFDPAVHEKYEEPSTERPAEPSEQVEGDTSSQRRRSR